MNDTHTLTPVSRRSLLRHLGAGAMGLTGALVGLPALASPAKAAWSSNFAPFASPAFVGHLRTDAITVEGQIPRALRGTLFRNGPARFARGQSHLSHWFDGDGMVQALRFEDGRASHQGRLVHTPKATQEAAAGHFLYGGFGSVVPHSQPVESPDVVNVANINLLAMQDGKKLYALWEGGSAIEIDPTTLTTLGAKTWSPETHRAPFSAHPRIAPDGTVWSFGYMAGSGSLLIYQIGANGILQRQTLLKVPQADMVHDFAITQNHLVFLLQPLHFQKPDTGSLPNLLAGMRWQDSAPLIACVVKQSDFSLQMMDLPNGGVFHLGNAWEEGGVIRLGYARYPDILSVMHNMRVDRVGGAGALGTSTWTEVELPLASGRAIQHPTELAHIEFPRWDQRRTSMPNQLTVMMQRSPSMNADVMGFNTLLALHGGKVQRHNYGDGWLAEEHLYVPHPTQASEHSGWIVGTAYHWPTEKTTVSVFEAGHVAQGPVAQLRLPYGLPLGLHGQFVPA
jgi:carotenoid cleavage dioxygenase-like enzyme